MRLKSFIATLCFILNVIWASSEKTSPYYDDDDPDEQAPSVVLNHLDSVNYTEETEANATISYVPGSSKRLTEYLLAKHNVNAPPDGLLNVAYELELVHILGIDELKQTMSVLIYVDEHWVDPSLVWDPALFGGITKTWIPMDKVWVPDIIIFNM
ncbi:unnamed protein product [Caenorhabditis auriculariae]|uniref:Neurotransmitter-gated ion-channel ligand-binding domain-containing protein n=1 Tax=Caenorhabditis auriculariae TaxID=2777116 RepID=A0A8S1HD72_9PELO|nr:unnamed protein product [Caenorhabditis auriculariae]